ncbi:MAG: nitroreductase family protein [Bradymonadales bacterium]|jgi:nitroreductase
MTFESLAKKRYSCRSYDANRTVEREKLDKIIETANLAPSACNAQPYQFFIVTGAKMKEVAEARSLKMNKFIEDCGAFLVICEGKYNFSARLGASMKDQDYRSIDIGIVCAHMVFQAHELGLGTCILGMFDENKVKKIIGCDNRVRLILAVGYPSSESRAPAVKKRKPIHEIAKYIE